MKDVKKFIGQGEEASLIEFMFRLHGPDPVEVSTRSH